MNKYKATMHSESILCYSLILKWIKSFFPSSIYTQYPIMTEQKQVFIHFCKLIKKQTEISHLHKYSDPLLSALQKHLWQRLQSRVFLGMTLQAWHTCIWEVSPILLCRSSQALSIFRSLQRCLIGFKSGSGYAIQGHSETCP